MARLWYALVLPYLVRVLNRLALSMTDLRNNNKADIFNQPCYYLESDSRDKVPHLFNDIFKLRY